MTSIVIFSYFCRLHPPTFHAFVTSLELDGNIYTLFYSEIFSLCFEYLAGKSLWLKSRFLIHSKSDRPLYRGELLRNTFSHLRSEFFEKIRKVKPFLSFLQDADKFTFLLNEYQIVKHTGNFLRRGFEFRLFLPGKHKNTEIT